MEKPAPADHPIHVLIRRRWSPRVFASQPVEAATLRSLLEAARWAPSSYNEQPWSFIVATRENPVEYERLLTCLVDDNQKWAWHAPVLMLSVARLTFERNGKTNRHAFHDVGQAMANLSLQATAMGVFVHQMAGFDAARAREIYAIPDDHEPVATVAIGYPVDPHAMPNGVLADERRARQRKPVGAFVYGGRWGEIAGDLIEADD